MHAISELSVVKTLLLLTASGFLAVIAFAGPQIAALLDERQKLTNDARLTELAYTIGALTHELQKERGASAGFLSSGGTDFADALPTQRAVSDEAIEDFLAASERAKWQFEQATVFAAKINDVTARMSALPELRRQVDNLQVDTRAAVGQITALNRATIDLLPEMGKAISYADAARAVQRHAIFMTAKDIAGLERATGATAFARAADADGVIPPAILERYQTLVREQAVLFRVYDQIASTQLQDALRELLASDAYNAVNKLRETALSSNPEAILSISSEAFFVAITQKIDLIKAVEDLGADELVEETSTAIKLLNEDLLSTIVLLCALILGVGTAAAFLALRVLKSIVKTSDRIAAMAEGDLNSEIPEVAPSDLKKISSALSVFRAGQLERLEEAEKQKNLELSSITGIERVSEAVGAGDFSARLRLRDLTGATLVLGEGLNSVLTVAEATVNEQLKRDREALERQTAIAEAGRKAVAEMSEVVAACVRGDFSQRLSLDGKDGVFKDLCQGVNRIGEVTQAGLHEVFVVLEAISAGNLSERSSGHHEGIFHDICQKLDETGAELTRLVEQISGGASTVQSSSAELAVSADDLALRTERNAAALVETSAAIEQLTASVKSTADGARKIGETAITTEEETATAAQAAADMVSAIESIAASSAEISNITNVIDDISFQTNLLALNAGVEAARAGDAGRGFAVVASEVRTLAQRAAEAAREINTLISKSQAQVKDGVSIVTNSRAALDGIQTSIQKMTNEFRSMIDAAAEQSAGINEINRAVLEMEQTTQQNAAMFEETSAVVMTMREESDSLMKTVSRFSISSNANSQTLGVPAASCRLAS